MSVKLRAWATPLTVGTFLLMAVTGVLMFFHASTGINKLVHEWVGLVMIAAVGAHLVLNWRAFSTYFKRPVAVGIVAGFAALLAVSFFPVLGPQGPGGRPDMTAVNMVANAPLAALGPVLGLDSDAVLERLADGGYPAEAGDTLRDLAGGDMRLQVQLISLLAK